MKTTRLVLTFAIGFMLAAATIASAQVKIGSNPTTIDPSNNLEVESTDPAKRVSINKNTGKVTIADGSQGNGFVLTSDANGVATWLPLSTAKIPQTVFNGAITAPTTVPTFTVHDDPAQRLPLVPSVGGENWLPAEKRYTIPANGSYSVQVGLSCNSTTGAGVVLWTRIWVVSENGGPLFKGTSPLGGTAGDWQSVVYTGRLSAGDAISLEGYTMQTDGNPPINPIWTGTCGRAYMTITKIE
ncbi:hypothetical protein [Dyadobacter beijingensis]|nr:hypothetical protein [Dyadobacter beijingensis]